MPTTFKTVTYTRAKRRIKNLVTAFGAVFGTANSRSGSQSLQAGTTQRSGTLTGRAGVEALVVGKSTLSSTITARSGAKAALTGSGVPSSDVSGHSGVRATIAGTKAISSSLTASSGAEAVQAGTKSVNQQVSVPVSDGAIGGWTTQTGSTVNLYSVVDELIPDDSDYDQSSLYPANDILVLNLQDLSIPIAGTQTLSYRYSKDAGTTEQVNLTVELLEGTTVVQSWTHNDIPTAWTQASQTVTGTITTYTGMKVRLTARQV